MPFSKVARKWVRIGELRVLTAIGLPCASHPPASSNHIRAPTLAAPAPFQPGPHGAQMAPTPPARYRHISARLRRCGYALDFAAPSMGALFWGGKRPAETRGQENAKNRLLKSWGTPNLRRQYNSSRGTERADCHQITDFPDILPPCRLPWRMASTNRDLKGLKGNAQNRAPNNLKGCEAPNLTGQQDSTLGIGSRFLFSGALSLLSFRTS